MTDSPAPAAQQPRAPGAVELFELAVASLAGPEALRAAASRPAPSFASCAALTLGAGAAAVAITAARLAALSGSGLIHLIRPAALAAMGAAALGFYAAAVMLLAVLVLGAAHALGGSGGFDRALQAAALVSVLGPAQALCNGFAFAWLVPPLLAAWIASGALQGLFGAKATPARALCAVLAAVVVAVQGAARYAVDRAAAAGETATPPSLSAPAAALEGSIRELARETAAPPPGAAAPSGLDLLRGPSVDGGSPAAPAPATAAQVERQAQSAQADAAGVLDAVGPMLDNPALAKNMTAAQKADLAELKSMIADLKNQIRSGKTLSDPEFAARMARSQKLMMKTLSAASAAPGGAP